tara:strand:+ start:259 stop:909 length:651 start_codon:yes stop_codon:yes gene_type:complete
MSIILNVIASLAEGEDMRSEKKLNIRDYSYNSYGISIICVCAFLVGIILCLCVVFADVAKAEDNKTSEIDFDKIGWPSQLIYDSANGCHRGTLNWIYAVNPGVRGTLPPAPVQIAMLQHCFCVLNRIRNQYTFTEYMKFVTRPEVVGRLFMTNALKCVQVDGTLAGIMIINETKTDNKTKTDNSTIIPEKPEVPTESLPDQPKEEPSSEPETIFQG